jgi:hypothetical protein
MGSSPAEWDHLILQKLNEVRPGDIEQVSGLLSGQLNSDVIRQRRDQGDSRLRLEPTSSTGSLPNREIDTEASHAPRRGAAFETDQLDAVGSEKTFPILFRSICTTQLNREHLLLALEAAGVE